VVEKHSVEDKKECANTESFPVLREALRDTTQSLRARPPRSLKGYEPKDVELRASVKKTGNSAQPQELSSGKLATPAWWTRKTITRTIFEAIGQ